MPDFPSLSYADWRARVERELKGADFDRRLVTRLPGGLAIQPLYSPGHATEAPGPAGAAPFVRGTHATPRPWELRQRVELAELDAARDAIAEEEGVPALTLALQDGVRSGVGVVHEDELRRLLNAVDLSTTAIHLEAGRAGFAAAGWMLRIWDDAGQGQGGLGLDPLGLLADQGHLALRPREAWRLTAALARACVERGGIRAVRVDGAPWHDAGADEVTELAATLSGAVAALRGLSDGGLSLEQACGQIEVSLRLGTEMLLDVAKLRAFRALWARVAEACGLSGPEAQLPLHVQLGERCLSRRDPWVNMLRDTAACFAGAVGGADAITSLPFDAALGQPEALGRRVARNTQHLLAEECHLARVVDPAGGSWAVEAMTEQLSERAWEAFQAIEGEGGLAAALRSGSLHQRVDAAWAERQRELRRRKRVMVGVSEFPNAQEALLDRAPAQHDAVQGPWLDAVAQAMAKPGGVARALSGALEPEARVEGVRVRPFELRRFAAPFEALRDAADALAERGRRPRVFVAVLGSLAQVNARLTWTQGLLEVAGHEVVVGPFDADDGRILEAFREADTALAVLCGPDSLYPERVAGLARPLAEAGARFLGLAGRPEALGEDSGAVQDYLHVGADVMELFERMQDCWEDAR
ncbi:MAG: methylmalonyl-CoA mutase [Alphaproteobacteria bacterium]|nr:methylmalonyl-CoA mutase [Alphaproteobacteria bacterium]MCB9796781.1 methylmalonyl-CoA mutase [Alphaproteobacteria bacterium]